MSYLRYFCLLVYSGVQHILSCDFILGFFLRLVYSMLIVSLDCPFFLLSLRYSLTFSSLSEIYLLQFLIYVITMTISLRNMFSF
jgi:hypothetical protein